MVRLKAFVVLTLLVLTLRFNSYMVRLKDYNPGRYPSKMTCFNSYMVRLKVGAAQDKMKLQQSFNSYMVRLKVFWVSLNVHGLKSFNSYMVRLKAIVSLISACCKTVSIPIWCD